MAPTLPVGFTGQKEPRKVLSSQMTKKSRKHLKGNDLVEIMDEPRVFGRVDTVPEDVDAPKRKRIRLSVDGLDVPMRVFPLSKISLSEKKDLELRLKFELEQVRVLQKKIASSVESPSSDGLRRPASQNSHRSSAFLAPPGKKPTPSQRKRGTIGHFEPQKPNALIMKQCETLLKRVMAHKYAIHFSTPVDPVKLNIPDYFTVIKHPMDLGTVKRNLNSGHYPSQVGFAADVRLTFSNSMLYNPSGNLFHLMAETLSKFFEGKWKSIESKLPADSETHSAPTRPGSRLETSIPSQFPPMKKKVVPVINEVKPEPPKLTITDEEKRNITLQMEALQGEFPERIFYFLKEQSSIAGQGSANELEFDVDAYSDKTLFKLRKLLDDYLLEKQKNHAKAEPCEMELINESGFSTSSLQPDKGNDVEVDEDVDIVGGNDPPISSYPPVEIEKDAVFRGSKCSSSSSSSGDSDSSSSDSDSCSSSGSEPDGAREETAGANLQQKQSLINGQDIKDKFMNVASGIELPKPASAEVDDNQEEESAPSEKLYRKAILKKRFADTILKAREKALEKGEKRDPEKLRREREELEKRQREEKARIQAEEALKKAEAKAAAEARRERELEREAARQKLQEMEKTVDINENIQFLKDLEMLHATCKDEDSPSIVEEASPEHVLGSFKFQGSSNPLEQLGLYMKVDDEFDEDEVPIGVKEPVNDVEEGEID